MDKKKKIIISCCVVAALAIGGGAIYFATRDSSPKNPKNMSAESINTSYNNSMAELNNAKQIVITKDLVSIGKSYDIEVDGKDFGDMDGEFIKITGDKFTLTNKDDVVLSTEKQIKRWGIKLNRLAEVSNNKGEVVGYIGEEKLSDLLKMGFNFHFYNKNKEEVGYLKQEVFNIFDTFKIYNMNDELCYEIKANFSPIVAKYTITVHNNKTIPVDQAIFMTGIINSVKPSKEKENAKIRNGVAAGVGAAAGSVINNKNNKNKNDMPKDSSVYPDKSDDKNSTTGDKKQELDLNKKPQTNSSTKPKTSSSKPKSSKSKRK